MEVAGAILAATVLGEEFAAVRVGLAVLAILVFGPKLHGRFRQWERDGGRINWRAVVWPVRPNPNATALVWIGRVLHWLSVAFAVLVGGAIIWLGPVEGLGLLGVVIGLVGAVPMAFFGRGFRFILAKE